MYPIQMAIAPDHVQRVGADGAGGAQEGQRFHWRNRQYNIEGVGVLRKLRWNVGWQKVTVIKVVTDTEFCISCFDLKTQPFRAPGRIASGVFFLEVSLALVGV